MTAGESRSEALTASSPNSPCLDRTRHTGHQDASNGNIVIQSRQSSTWECLLQNSEVRARAKQNDVTECIARFAIPHSHKPASLHGPL